MVYADTAPAGAANPPETTATITGGNGLGAKEMTVRVSRTKQVRQYEPETVDVTFVADIDSDADAAQVIDRMADFLRTAKSHIYAELGIEDISIDGSGIIREVVRGGFPGTVEVSNNTPAAASSPPPGADPSVPAEPPHDPRTSDADEKRANKAWAEARLEVAPGEFYDNRADKAAGKGHPKGPDYKHKTSGVGVWES